MIVSVTRRENLITHKLTIKYDHVNEVIDKPSVFKYKKIASDYFSNL